ncbi:hypothetical protein RR46_14154 [Papilio xuthus]|uniref:Uncharacterized protein n=1 Tax=Papilio xuthus TaxID=66420 RepID=A0A194PIQ6_PAPXU|nr:hypothetical protein RR46_14154 [Papilio xuthus]
MPHELRHMPTTRGAATTIANTASPEIDKKIMVFVYGAGAVAATSNSVSKYQRPVQSQYQSVCRPQETQVGTDYTKSLESSKKSSNYPTQAGKAAARIGYKYVVKILK